MPSQFSNASTTLESYINKPDSTMKTKQISMNELKDNFLSRKISKSSGYDDISFNVLENVLAVYVNLQNIYLIYQLKKRWAR